MKIREIRHRVLARLRLLTLRLARARRFVPANFVRVKSIPDVSLTVNRVAARILKLLLLKLLKLLVRLASEAVSLIQNYNV